MKHVYLVFLVDGVVTEGPIFPGRKATRGLWSNGCTELREMEKMNRSRY